MTIPTTKNSVPAIKVFGKSNLNIELEIALLIEKFEKSEKLSGKNEEALINRIRDLKQVARQTELCNPEKVKDWLAKKKTWNNKTKS
jgi:hypothetical protein